MKPPAKFSIAAAALDTVSTQKGPDLRVLVEPPKPAKERKQASRVGAKGITIWLAPEVWRRLKMVSLQRGETIQDLVAGWIEGEVRGDH